MRLTALVTAAAISLAATACAPEPGAELDANKELIRRFGEIGNAADWEALASVVADDFTRHSAATDAPPVTSRDQFIELQKSYLASFPDQRVTLREMIAEGAFVAVLATYSGTNSGPIGDAPATGKAVEVPFLGLFRIEGGRIAELWVEWDNVAMLRQLGMFPVRGPEAGGEGQ